MIDTVDELLEISSRLEHLESAAEWITRETVNSDSAISQTGTLITVLADELRERIYELVHTLEENNQKEKAEREWKEKLQSEYYRLKLFINMFEYLKELQSMEEWQK